MAITTGSRVQVTGGTHINQYGAVQATRSDGTFDVVLDIDETDKRTSTLGQGIVERKPTINLAANLLKEA
jgi:hypothetical protein